MTDLGFAKLQVPDSMLEAALAPLRAEIADLRARIAKLEVACYPHLREQELVDSLRYERQLGERTDA